MTSVSLSYIVHFKLKIRQYSFVSLERSPRPSWIEVEGEGEKVNKGREEVGREGKGWAEEDSGNASKYKLWLWA